MENNMFLQVLQGTATETLINVNKGYVNVTVHSPSTTQGTCLFNATPTTGKIIALFGELPEGYSFDESTHLFTQPDSDTIYSATFEGTYEIKNLEINTGIELPLEELQYSTKMERLIYKPFQNVNTSTDIKSLNGTALNYVILQGRSSYLSNPFIVGSIETIVGESSRFDNNGTISLSQTNIVGEFLAFVRAMISVANRASGTVSLQYALDDNNCTFNGNHYSGNYTLEWTSTTATLKQGSTIIDTVTL